MGLCCIVNVVLYHHKNFNQEKLPMRRNIFMKSVFVSLIIFSMISLITGEAKSEEVTINFMADTRSELKTMMTLLRSKLDA